MSNRAWSEFKLATLKVGRWTTRRDMRDLLRATDRSSELHVVRRGVFGAWRHR